MDQIVTHQGKNDSEQKKIDEFIRVEGQRIYDQSDHHQTRFCSFPTDVRPTFLKLLSYSLYLSRVLPDRASLAGIIPGIISRNISRTCFPYVWSSGTSDDWIVFWSQTWSLSCSAFPLILNDCRIRPFCVASQSKVHTLRNEGQDNLQVTQTSLLGSCDTFISFWAEIAVNKEARIAARSIFDKWIRYHYQKSITMAFPDAS